MEWEVVLPEAPYKHLQEQVQYPLYHPQGYQVYTSKKARAFKVISNIVDLLNPY
jgi:hypothetical protein